MMNLMMTSAPLAMVMYDHSIGDAALGIQWHAIGMYAPSFFTGALIARLGLRTIMAAGLTLIIAAAVVGFMGNQVADKRSHVRLEPLDLAAGRDALSQQGLQRLARLG